MPSVPKLEEPAVQPPAAKVTPPKVTPPMPEAIPTKGIAKMMFRFDLIFLECGMFVSECGRIPHSCSWLVMCFCVLLEYTYFCLLLKCLLIVS